MVHASVSQNQIATYNAAAIVSQNIPTTSSGQRRRNFALNNSGQPVNRTVNVPENV